MEDVIAKLGSYIQFRGFKVMKYCIKYSRRNLSNVMII